MMLDNLELRELLQMSDCDEHLIGDSKINPKTCTARQYVETFIFPTLLPALYGLFAEAKQNLVFERKRTKFNACDFITKYLYNNNPDSKEREKLDLWEIPFVKEILSRKPLLPIPLSLIWSEEEATLVIQSHWRGFLVRRDPEVQELRQYQKEMKESSYHIMFKVEEFWKKHQIEDVGDDENEKDEEIKQENEEDTLKTPQ